MTEQGGLYEALDFLYPKLTKNEMTVIIALIRDKTWTRVRPLAINTNILRSKIYGVLSSLATADIIEEQYKTPKLPADYKERNIKARGRILREQGFNPRGESNGYLTYRINPMTLRFKICHADSVLRTLRDALLEDTP